MRGTASTLVNGTLPGLLAAIDGRAPVELVGLDGSGLPDPLFARGVAVGGRFDGRDPLLAQLAAGRNGARRDASTSSARTGIPGSMRW